VRGSLTTLPCSIFHPTAVLHFFSGFLLINFHAFVPRPRVAEIQALKENTGGKSLALEKLYPAEGSSSNEVTHTISPFQTGSTGAKTKEATPPKVSFGFES